MHRIERPGSICCTGLTRVATVGGGGGGAQSAQAAHVARQAEKAAQQKHEEEMAALAACEELFNKYDADGGNHAAHSTGTLQSPAGTVVADKG